MWDPQRLTTLWASKACYRDSFTFLPFSSMTKHHAPCVLNLGGSWKWGSTLSSGRYTPEKRATRNHWIGIWVILTIGILDGEEKISPSGRNLTPTAQLAVKSLYWLTYAVGITATRCRQKRIRKTTVKLCHLRYKIQLKSVEGLEYEASEWTWLFICIHFMQFAHRTHKATACLH
jgi:hypothetical protein